MLVEINGTLLKLSKLEAIGPADRKFDSWSFRVFLAGTGPLVFSFADMTIDPADREQECLQSRQNLVAQWTQFVKWQSTLNLSKHPALELFS